MDISDYVKEAVDTADVSLGDSTMYPRHVVKIYKTYIEELMSDRELTLAVSKRFKGKNTVHGSPGYSQLVVWCLSTDMYKLCSDNFVSVENSDVSLAWQFIDTISVSSTKKCRDLVNKNKHSRSSVGFSRSIREITRPPPSNLDRSVLPRVHDKPVLENTSQYNSSSHVTMEEMIAEDCTYWCTKSHDPLSATMDLCRNIASLNQGI